MTVESSTRELLIRQMRWESDGVLSLQFESADGAGLPPWQPGAHLDVHLGAGGGLIRQYSLCGDPADKTRYRVAVLRERDGGRGGSRHVHESLRPGQAVSVSEPRNNFALVDAPRYVFLAGGIGITPILPMIAEAEQNGAEWELHYGGRDRASMAFLDELECYGERVHLVLGEPLDLASIIGTPSEGAAVYTCGPAGLLDAVESYNTVWPGGAIHLERFQAKKIAAPDGGDAPVRVTCEKSGVAVTVEAERPILDALEEVGVDVPSSCREGICGTCETRVLRGMPDHRDSLLSSAEQESGETMLICVSRAKSEELVLDL